MLRHRSIRFFATSVGQLGLIGIVAMLIAGCTNVSSLVPIADTQLGGNWQFSPVASGASALPAFSGSLAVNGPQVTGILHPMPNPHGGQCAPSTASFAVAGVVDAQNVLTLKSASFSGGALALTGTVAPDQKTLLDASYLIVGGPCAIAKTPVLAAQYAPISGTYAGTINSVTGNSATLSNVFTQTTQPDANGIYQLQGQATFGSSQPCLASSVITSSSVTGSTLAATYSQTQAGVTTTVNVVGTFNTDASVVTLTSYSITGGYCDGDTGSGQLTKQ